MTQLFRRQWQVIVDKFDVSALDLEFKILRTLKPEPNKFALTLYNLNENHRAELLKRNQPNGPSGKLVGVPVQIEAGYVDQTTMLLSADMREMTSVRDGTDWKTTIAGDDGGRSYREGEISKQFTAGTPVGNILKECATAMSIGLGNVTNFQSEAELQGVGNKLPHSFTTDGSASAALDRVVKSIGLTWSIQNGALQLLKKGKPLSQKAIEINQGSGLVGSPHSSIDASVSLGNPQQYAKGAKPVKPKQPKPKDPSIIKLQTLMIPDLVPGRRIQLTSDQFNGDYYLTECEYVGQSWGNDWYVNSIARVYING